MLNVILGLIIISLIMAAFSIIAPILIIIGILFLIYKVYESIYFRGEKFIRIKEEIENYTNECNDLNRHIEDLKQSDSVFEKKDYGVANIQDTSKHNYKRKELDKFSNSKHVYNCSLSVCRNAQKQPFNYICKYFNIDKNEESLEHFEELLNNFSAVEEGKEYLVEKKQKIIKSIENRIPSLIKRFSKKKLEEKLGFEQIDFSDLYFPKYTMQYISAGGNSSMKTEVIFNLDSLERFINYLAEHIKWRKSVEGQRALMTPKLRNFIKERDGYTCIICQNTTEKEPNLLLEIDHIIPLSKGGMTKEDNLQTLCWKCNRSKGAKVL